MILAGTLTLALAASVGSDLSNTIDELIGGFSDAHWSRLATEDSDTAVAVLVTGAATLAEGEELSRLIAGLSRSRIERHIGRPVFAVALSAQDIDEGAAELGAEWIVLVKARARTDRLALTAEIREIDTGLWGPRIKREQTPIIATSSALLSGKKLELLTMTVPKIEPHLVRRVESRLVDMAVCDLEGDGSKELVVLGVDRVMVLEGRELRTTSELGLGELPRAQHRSREPLGHVLCKGNSVLFSHSDLDRGYRLTLSGTSLSISKELVGAPISMEEDPMLLTALGQSRYDTAVIRGEKVELSEPLYDLGRSGRDILGLTAAYEIARLSPKLTPIGTVGTSGRGFSVFSTRKRTWLVTTSSTSHGVDQTQVRALEGGAPLTDPIEFPGPIVATAGVVQPDGSMLVYAAVLAPAPNRTDLYRIHLEEAPAP